MVNHGNPQSLCGVLFLNLTVTTKHRWPRPKFRIYDCVAGFSNWMQGWSDSKKVGFGRHSRHWKDSATSRSIFDVF